ncbi:hypothetical protein Z946_978 [Sulfitobacter noctilucicola]|uniref:Uncharacterized protein n=1 Tax=Sulfitobacter noctilucicola TaxID=1342301 RepID=A0A7W6M780_9RHOB|nr:hypothetical protein [Sulfitobacter noctilucicola]KIN62122.1 hypothetical protein Z946_978 [Sulfitobacter noctilucicola]MBB4173358.1 hypothetical protein [Sulfitobacter noctilucicola]
MTFFRPEARAALWRWREMIAGLCCAAIGIWLVLGPGFLLAVLGYAMLGVGGVLAWLGYQRGRFRSPDGGAGAVQVDEGQVTYYGPLTGGSVDLREMDSLTLEGSMFPAHWRLAQRGQTPLLIPVNAAGADALFDAFATLPGLRTERMLATLKADPHQAVVIWQRPDAAPQGALLH